MHRVKKVMKVIHAGECHDSRIEQRRYWRSRPASERVREGRALLRKMHWWMHGRDIPPHMAKIVRRFRHKA